MLRLYKNSFLVDVNAKYVLMETKMRGLDVILRIRRLQKVIPRGSWRPRITFPRDWVRYIFLYINPLLEGKHQILQISQHKIFFFSFSILHSTHTEHTYIVGSEISPQKGSSHDY